MAFIVWKEDFSVNIRKIDEQHKKLVEMLNHLHTAMSEGKGSTALKTILGEMAAYTVEHFKTEEELFDKYGYPETAAHKAVHDAFVKKVGEFIEKMEQGKMLLSLEVGGFLRDWLARHILKEDKAYIEFLNQKGVY